MRILVLDDDDERHAYFRRQLIGNDVVHVHTYSECLDALLGQEIFEVVFLDHDLNGNGYQSLVSERPGHQERAMTRYSRKGELDGRDVAEDMVKLLPEEKRPYQTIVHSWNPDGAKEMIAILKDGGFKNILRWEFNPNVDLKFNSRG